MLALATILHSSTSWDGRASEEITDLRNPVLTPVMELLSQWWVKAFAFALAGFAVDLLRVHRGRRHAALVGICVVASYQLGSLLSTLIKPLAARPRPPLGDAGITAIGSLPSSASFPSGHATAAFAAATALAVLEPALRRWAFGLAALIAFSRVYLGMHYLGDVCAGALLGLVTGGAVGLGARLRLGEGAWRLRPARERLAAPGPGQDTS